MSIDFFFFNDTATTEIYTLSLHDALPICRSFDERGPRRRAPAGAGPPPRRTRPARPGRRPAIWFQSRADSTAVRADRKSTRLNSSHLVISYAVFCLKKKTTFAADTQSQHE